MEQQKESKKRKNSKVKGSGFEGTIAKKLTAALQPLNFMRTPGSGARVGGKNFDTLGQMLGEDALKVFVGDVVPVNERKEGLKFNHVLECKFYASQDTFTLLASGSAKLFGWFEEVVVDAAKLDKNPLLIFKWNHTPIFVALDTMHKHAPRVAQKPCFSILTYGDNPRALDIFYLDELLKEQSFWFQPTI